VFVRLVCKKHLIVAHKKYFIILILSFDNRDPIRHIFNTDFVMTKIQVFFFSEGITFLIGVSFSMCMAAMKYMVI
jgi:hypothetical protein